ncbi:hypothetical protein C8T65DRAFT_662974 [Cerioporus squamosus]|nr:hypothetical protein C8T65DRAFT_662974 [Cerioporus squamosus]
MLLSGSLAHSGRRTHSMKRRKLTHPPPPALDMVAKPDSLLLPVSATANHIKAAPVCASCHRAFFGAKQSQLVECARCRAVTCVICSRTCNGCLSSLPVTSAPAPYAVAKLSMPLASSRRPALALHTNTALGGAPLPFAGRRRKMRDRDCAEDDDGGCERLGNGERDSEREKRDDGVLPGCERTVCRNCACEIPERELTTCYDCAARLQALAQDPPRP